MGAVRYDGSVFTVELLDCGADFSAFIFLL